MKYFLVLLFCITILNANTFQEAVTEYKNKNYSKSLSLFEKLANEDHPDAQYNLAIMYLNGIGTQVNEVLGFIWLDLSAQNGNKQAQNKLGTLYESGNILDKKDLKKAISLYKQSALQDNSIAQYNLAQHYTDIHTEDKLQQAFYWYEKASANGNIAAINNLANLYFNGQGTKKDLKKAYELYKKGTELKDGVSTYNLSMMYFQGDYVKQNDDKALQYLIQSAMLGTPLAQVRLGKFYLKGGRLVEKDYKKALTWFYEAAKQKYPAGLHQMGVCYFYGYGVTKDKKKAAFWFYQASDLGYQYSTLFIKKHKLNY